jgi:hypothetical protein
MKNRNEMVAIMRMALVNLAQLSTSQYIKSKDFLPFGAVVKTTKEIVGKNGKTVKAGTIGFVYGIHRLVVGPTEFYDENLVNKVKPLDPKSPAKAVADLIGKMPGKWVVTAWLKWSTKLYGTFGSMTGPDGKLLKTAEDDITEQKPVAETESESESDE